MKEDNEFRYIGKDVPYKTPPGFFDSITEKTLKKAILREKNLRKTNIRRLIYSLAASVAILFFLGYHFIHFTEKMQPSELIVMGRSPVLQKVVPKSDISSKQITVAETTKTTSLKPSVTEISEPFRNEGLNDILTEMTDDELQQMAAQYKTDTFIMESVQ